MTSDWQKNNQLSYDRVADLYANEYYDELSQKSFDKNILQQFAQKIGDKGFVCDIGCGPGEIGRYLFDEGLVTTGFDLSRNMLACAKKLNDKMNFVHSNMLHMPCKSNSFAGAVAFYSINCIKRIDLQLVLLETNRILVPNGQMLLAIHLGEGELHEDIWFDMPVNLDTTFFSLEEVANSLEVAGFMINYSYQRNPYPIEWQNQRGYIWAEKMKAN